MSCDDHAWKCLLEQSHPHYQTGGYCFCRVITDLYNQVPAVDQGPIRIATRAGDKIVITNQLIMTTQLLTNLVTIVEHLIINFLDKGSH